jgi:hypothetical protein
VDISKERAIQLIGIYLSRELKVAHVVEGWPEGVYGNHDEQVWTIQIPPEPPRIGASRFIVISKLTGGIFADQFAGE